MSEQPKDMFSISEIAKRDGISRQAVSKLVKKLIDGHNIPVQRDGGGRIRGVSLSHWERYRDQYTNPAKRKKKAEPKAAGGDSYEEGRRKNEWLKFERSKIEFEETAEQLIRTDRLTSALQTAGQSIQRRIERLQNRADDLAQAGAREGAHGIRVALREIAFEINKDIADSLQEIAAKAPQRDEAIGKSSRERAR